MPDYLSLYNILHANLQRFIDVRFHAADTYTFLFHKIMASAKVAHLLITYYHINATEPTLSGVSMAVTSEFSYG
jgi:hypothetical protein